MSNSPYERGEQAISQHYRDKEMQETIEQILKSYDKEQAAIPKEPSPAAIVRNAVQTPDGTIIESRSTHDFHSHEDANGEVYIVDGGREYLRHSLNIVPATDLSVSYYEGHEKVRENFSWGTYGISGEEVLTYILLKDMTDAHIEACIEDNLNVYLFQTEQKWRKSVGARKLVRKQDIERLLVLKDKHEHNQETTSMLDACLVTITEGFNTNEFN